jgi:cell wall-associated NlpC family hydrolase
MIQTREIVIIFFATVLISCNWKVPESDEGLIDTSFSSTDIMRAKIDPLLIDSLRLNNNQQVDNTQNKDTLLLPPSKGIETRNVKPEELMSFAETLIATPYVWGSVNPQVGFDCSGFITYVFNHFNISVPRSSIDFTNVGKQINVEEAKRGDIILFTGTNPLERYVGHMGLIVSNADTLKFIHSTSGKAMGVTITPLSSYYQSRFVKTIRFFPQNDL